MYNFFATWKNKNGSLSQGDPDRIIIIKQNKELRFWDRLSSLRDAHLFGELGFSSDDLCIQNRLVFTADPRTSFCRQGRLRTSIDLCFELVLCSMLLHGSLQSNSVIYCVIATYLHVFWCNVFNKQFRQRTCLPVSPPAVVNFSYLRIQVPLLSLHSNHLKSLQGFVPLRKRMEKAQLLLSIQRARVHKKPETIQLRKGLISMSL